MVPLPLSIHGCLVILSVTSSSLLRPGPRAVNSFRFDRSLSDRKTLTEFVFKTKEPSITATNCGRFKLLIPVAIFNSFVLSNVSAIGLISTSELRDN